MESQISGPGTTNNDGLIKSNEYTRQTRGWIPNTPKAPRVTELKVKKIRGGEGLKIVEFENRLD